MSVIAPSKTVRYSQPGLPAHYETESEIYLCSFAEQDYTDKYAPMDADLSEVEDLFEPYIRQFTQRWNAFLEREDKLFAEIYALSEGGMMGVAFFIVKREGNPDRLRVIEESWEAMRCRFPKATWFDVIHGQSFLELLNEVVIIVKPNARCYWTEKEGEMNADDTIGQHFADTIPEGWKKNLRS